MKRIEQKRHFRVDALVSGIGMVLLVVIWATSEYHNAGGWPTHGFSQSSGIHDVWNLSIIYPVIAWLLILGGHGWFVYGRRPISESDIKREIERQSGRR
ncbi:MAG: 2TM domain-containing protein [Acidimicrobiales bacterium]